MVVHKQYKGNDGVKLLKGNATSNYEISNKRQLESQAEEDVKSSVLFFLSFSFDRLDLTGDGLVGRRVQVQVQVVRWRRS